MSRLRIGPALVRWAFLAGLAALVGLSLAACAPRVHEPVKVVEKDSGSMVVLRVGDKVEISLDASPTTGYVWEAALPDITVARQLGEPQFTPESDALGAGGALTFVYEAIAPGEQILTLIYHRPSEPDVPPLRTFTLDLLVRER